MLVLWLVTVVVAAVAATALLLVLFLKQERPAPVDFGPVVTRLEAMERAFERTERNFREDLRQLREETQGSVVRCVSELGKTQGAQLEAVRAVVDRRLEALQQDNTAKLEQMRRTVDEQLQGTLEKRLNESFQLVSERLEQVYKGLGEMQTLASGVGDLKKVLSDVRARGAWGEIQLGALLDEMLSPDQFARNVATTRTAERVEFAIKLPGAEPGESVWLPIDSKFPQEDYLRVVEASERGDSAGIETAIRQLEARVKACAKDIRTKYVSPPGTTDFAIMYLPTESLFAEVLRRPGLVETLQRDWRVAVTGPTTLAAFLNSLQMGFRTLAIQQRSGEVWNLLGAVKTEFGKYADVLEKVHTKLEQASKTVQEGLTRTRVINRKLRGVEESSEELSPLQFPEIARAVGSGDPEQDLFLDFQQ